MLRFAGIAALVIGLAAPAQAQQAGMTSSYLLGASQYGGQSLNLYSALGAPSYANAAQFGFAPDPALRQAVTRSVLGEIGRKDPGLAAALGKNPFGSFGPALAAHDIRDSQIDDALAFMMLALWDAANASSAETTAGQAQGVKRQARSLLASMGGQPRTSSVQEASDSIYLTALMVSILSSKVLEGRNPTQVAQLQQMARQETQASFGVDFSRLRLTEQGLLPR